MSYLVVLLLLGVYFLPTLFAVATRSSDLGFVFAVNALLGWTGSCWYGAFIIAWATATIKICDVERKEES